MPDDYYVSQYSGEEIDERLTAAHNAVRYDAAQTLTDAQKTQARENIAAGSAADLAKKPDALLTYTMLHVAKTGNDTTGDGSESKPYLTIKKALNSLPHLLLDRVIVRVHVGNYNENVLITNFVGREIEVVGDSNESVTINTLYVMNNNLNNVRIENLAITGNSGDGYNWSLKVVGAQYAYLQNIICTNEVPNSYVGAFYISNALTVVAQNCTISNKNIALDVIGSVVYLNNTVTGTNNTVSIRCGSGWGNVGGYVQKGGANIAGEEQKGFGGQIW